MRRVMLLLSIFMLIAMALSATATAASIIEFEEPASGDSAISLITYEVGTADTDWFSIAFTNKAYSSFDTDFSKVGAVSTIPLSLGSDDVARNSSPVYVSWILVTKNKVNVLIAENGELVSSSSPDSRISYQITSEGAEEVGRDASKKLLLGGHDGASLYGSADSREIKINTVKGIDSAVNGEYKATINVYLESAT